MHKMLFDDRIDVRFSRIAVPDPLRINHDGRALHATIEAPGLIDAHLALPGETERLDPILGVVAHGCRAFVGAAGFPALTLVDAEKYMVAIIGFGHGYSDHCVNKKLIEID